MKTLAHCLVLAGTLSLITNVDAQQTSHSNAEPTRWTQAPTTIDTATTPAASQDSNFPALMSSPTSRSAEGDVDGDGNGVLTEPAITVTSSLAVVLGLFAALVWISRKFGSRSMNQGAIPREILQSLGTTPIDAKTRVTMLRCGNRVLVLAQTATGIHPLSEITDPEEVRHLTAHCLGDAKGVFASTLQSIQREPAGSGFVGEKPVERRKRGKLFATA